MVYHNDNVKKITGYSKEEFLSDKISFVELYNPEFTNYIFEEVHNCLSNNKPFSVTYQLKHSSGNWIWIEENGVGIYVDGELVLIEGFLNDITDRKNAELALQESEKKYRILFENMANGFALHEIICNENEEPIDYRFLEVNPAYEKLTGLKGKDIIGRTLLEVIPNIEKYWIEVFGKVAITGESTNYENYVKEFDKHYEVYVFSPKKFFFAVIVNDITSRKKIEEALNQRITTLTQPLGDLSKIKFKDLFNIEDIQSIQDAFSDATGVASIITEINGTPITKPSNFCGLCNDIIRKTEIGRINCYKSDAVIGSNNPDGPIVQPCLSGALWDAGASINVGNKHIANWLIGQILDPDQDESKMLDYAKTIGADIVEYSKALKKVKRMPKEQFHKVSQALYLISKQLSLQALNNILQARHITEIKKAEDIIKEQVAKLEIKNTELERFTYTVSQDRKSVV